jgi:hypothetical protein
MHYGTARNPAHMGVYPKSEAASPPHCTHTGNLAHKSRKNGHHGRLPNRVLSHKYSSSCFLRYKHQHMSMSMSRPHFQPRSLTTHCTSHPQQQVFFFALGQCPMYGTV